MNTEEIVRRIRPVLGEDTDFALLLVKRAGASFHSRVATNMDRFDVCCAMKALVLAEEAHRGAPLPGVWIDYVTDTREV